MFKKLLLVLIIFSFSILVFALDDQGNPNDPTINERANACYEDGSMAGKCDTEWEWICGWYMIRFDYGIFSREEIPATCASLLPALPPEEVVVAPAGGNCQDANAYGWGYVDFGSGNLLPIFSTLYSDASCSTATINVTSVVMIYAPSGYSAADAICKSNLGPTFGVVQIGPNVWACS